MFWRGVEFRVQAIRVDSGWMARSSRLTAFTASDHKGFTV